MSDYSNLPLGAATDKSAPWYDVDNDEAEVNVVVDVRIVKDATLTSTNYEATTWYDEEADEDGYVRRSSGVDYKFYDLYDDYEHNEYSIVQMLDYLKKFVEHELENGLTTVCNKSTLKCLLQSCQGWEEVETDIEEA